MAFRSLYEDQMQYAQQIPKPSGNFMPPRPASELGISSMQRSLQGWPGTPKPAVDPTKPVGPIPSPSQRNIPQRTTYQSETASQASEQPAGPNVTPFLWNMMSVMRDMDVEMRGEYLETVSAGIKDKLDRFSLRLARGIPLTPEQDKRFQSLRGAFNDIQRYATNQEEYDQYLSAYGQSGEALSPSQYESWRVGQYRR
ncbi:MAG: hypothetical protein WC554_00925 [Clostridia bacterium]|jgi:hypothetical protein